MTLSVSKPVPVILSSNSLARLWPVSSEAVSYALKGVNGKKPPLQSLLETIAATKCYDAPIIFVQETALKLAIAQIKAIYGDDATIVATRSEISAGVLSSLAARLQVQKALSKRLVFLPATLAASDEKTLLRHLQIFAKVGAPDIKLDDDAICFVGARQQMPGAQLAFQLVHNPTKTGTLSVDKIVQNVEFPDNDQADFINPELTIIPRGPAIARSDAISNLLAQSAPTVLKACTHALDTAERIGNIIRPNGQFLALAGRVSLAEIIANAPEKARILMCGDDLETVRDWSSKFATIPKSQLFETQTVSNSSTTTITYEDRVLVLTKGLEGDVKLLTDRPNADRREQHSQDRIIERIESQPHSSVWKIELAPGQSLENECHFHRIESWSVVSGEGVAHLDDNPISAKAGSTIIIAPEVCHQITNIGDTPLVIYEMRMGRMMEDDDRLLIPSKLNQQSYAAKAAQK